MSAWIRSVTGRAHQPSLAALRASKGCHAVEVRPGNPFRTPEREVDRAAKSAPMEYWITGLCGGVLVGGFPSIHPLIHFCRAGCELVEETSQGSVNLAAGGSPDRRGACPESKCGSPHRECESRSLRQRWKKSGTDEDIALKGPCGRPLCGFDLSWVRFPHLQPFSMLRWFAMLRTKILWPSRAFSVSDRSRRGDIMWSRAAKAGPRSCRRAIPARISSTRPGVIMNFGTRLIPWKQFLPTLVSRSSSSGCISSRTRLFSAANAVAREGRENTDSSVSRWRLSLSP
jgi:hypothetical protein